MLIYFAINTGEANKLKSFIGVTGIPPGKCTFGLPVSFYE